MKVLLLTAWYFPQSVGGTEWYVRWLAKELRTVGVDVAIARPSGHPPGDLVQVVDGIRVFEYRAEERPDPRALYSGNLTQEEHESFERVLDSIRPDLVHAHSFTRGVGPGHLQLCRARGIRIVTTIHLPDLFCARGTMMLFGREACDGTFEPGRCADCSLEGLGVPQLIRRIAVCNRIPYVPHSFPILRTLSHRARVQQRAALSGAYLQSAERIIVVAQWLKDVFIRNGIEQEKIAVSRHGLGELPGSRRPCSRGSKPLVVGYLGRINSLKGVDIIVDAVGKSRHEVRLVIAGVANSADEQDYAENLQRRTMHDSRICWQGPVNTVEEKQAFFEAIDILAVPSRWFETGPLVVLEAFAHGKPVIGAGFGGIAELVTDGESGLLVDGDTPEQWGGALDRAVQIGREGWNVPSPRLASDVALEMQQIYAEVLSAPYSGQ